MADSVEILLPRLHKGQQDILDGSKRFNVIKCGRRFGKTILTEELTVQPMLDAGFVGYWTPTYKDLYDVWNELKYILHPVIESKDESVKQIRLITGGKLDMWSMEDPDNGRGRKYNRAIIDEAEKTKNLKQCWESTIRQTLTDYKGDAWLMSTPKFGMTYFKKLYKNAETQGNWASFKKSTYDNPFIDPAEIDEAKNQMDDLTFACEYLAEDVDVVDKPFVYTYEPSKHDGTPVYDPNHEVRLSFDFNRDPITAIAVQYIDEEIRILKAYKIRNSNIYELCERILVDFPDALLMVTGDATGKAGSALVKDNINYYTIIKNELRLSSGQLKVPTVNPRIEDNRVVVNSIIQHKKFIVHKEYAKDLIFDLKYVQMDADNKMVKDRSTEAAKADLLDCLRYYLNVFHAHELKWLNQKS